MQVVGFVTARLFFLYELDPMDRYCLSEAGGCLDTDPILYILTIGVVREWQKMGIASALLGLLDKHAREQLRYVSYIKTAGLAWHCR